MLGETRHIKAMIQSCWRTYECLLIRVICTSRNAF